MGAMRAALLAAGLLCAAGGGLASETPAPAVDARVIVLEALQRAARNVERGVELRHRSLMTREVRRFDGDGRVEEVHTGDYEVIPIDGARYERRLTVDGRPLNAEEQEGERRREADFREARRRARESGEDERDDDEIVFDEQLIERYEVAFEAEEVFRGRPSYRISFEPRPGRLPVRQRIDHALNKARGQIWIDKETYEAARVEFELTGRGPPVVGHPGHHHAGARIARPRARARRPLGQPSVGDLLRRPGPSSPPAPRRHPPVARQRADRGVARERPGGTVDIARPDLARKRRIRQGAYAVLATVLLVLVTFGVQQLQPAAPRVDRNTVYIDTVQRGPMVRQVRGHGDPGAGGDPLDPGDDGRARGSDRHRPGGGGDGGVGDRGAEQPGAGAAGAGSGAEPAGGGDALREPAGWSWRATCCCSGPRLASVEAALTMARLFASGRA